MDHVMRQGYSLSNAAGTCKSLTKVKELATSAVTEILVGTIANHRRQGNPGDNYHRTKDGATINCMGVKTYGYHYYAKHLPQMREIAHRNGKTVALSIIALEPEDTLELGRLATLSKMNALELDAGCGNLQERGSKKRMLSFDLKNLEIHLSHLLQLRRESHHHLEVRVKLAPYSDPVLLAEVADLIGSRGTSLNRIGIVTANTFANAFIFKRQDGILKPAIEYGNHLGGLGGDPYRAIGLGQVAQFRAHLTDHPIWGVGGISHGDHIWEYLALGAKGVQVGSAYYDSKDPEIFYRLVEELFYCPRIPNYKIAA